MYARHQKTIFILKNWSAINILNQGLPIGPKVILLDCLSIFINRYVGERKQLGFLNF